MFDLDRIATRLAGQARRVQVALIAIAFVVSSLVTLVHDSATQHVVCAEHGELTHGDESAVRTDQPAGDVALQDAPETAIQGHDHCLMASAMRESRLAPRAPAIVATHVATRDVAGALDRAVAAHRDGRLYRTAPKTSPPA